VCLDSLGLIICAAKNSTFCQLHLSTLYSNTPAMRLHPSLLSFFSIALISVLSACGGGGGSTPATSGTVTPPVVTTPDNSLELALRTGDASAITDAAPISIAARDFVAQLSDQQAKRIGALVAGVSSESFDLFADINGKMPCKAHGISVLEQSSFRFFRAEN
jgi:hypothetical protein